MGSRFPDYYRNDFTSPWGTTPGRVDSEFKALTTTGTVDAIYHKEAVVVTEVSGTYNTIHVSWPAVSGATSYKVYVGFSVYLDHATLRTEVTTLEATLQYFPSIPIDLNPQVWVKAVVGSNEILIQADSATFDTSFGFTERENNPLEPNYSSKVIDNDYMRFVYAEIRRHLITMLANDGEDFIIHIKRYSGTVCPCRRDVILSSGSDAVRGAVVDPDSAVGDEPNLSLDPQYGGLHQCTKCFGTGILGGYYLGFLNRMRYSAMPPSTIVFGTYSLNLDTNFNTRALWEPRLHDHSIAYRVKTGDMYEITTSQRGEIRGIPMHQEAKLNLLPSGDIRHLMTDAAIKATGAD